MKRNGISDGLGTIRWEFTVLYVISWIIIYLIAMKGIYSYSKVVWFAAVTTFLVLILALVSMIFLDGDLHYLEYMNTDFTKLEVYRVIAEQVLMETSVAHGTNIMLGSYYKKPKQLHISTLWSITVGKMVSLVALVINSKTLGCLDYDFELNGTAIEKGPAVPLVLWADLVVRIPGDHFWSSVTFFMIFTLSVVTVALLVQTVMSNLRGLAIEKYRWLLTIALCLFMAIIGLVTICTQGGIYVHAFLDYWPASMPRLPVAAFTAGVITYFYGQKTFCEDVYYAVAEYPNLYLRLCWAISPVAFMLMFAAGTTFNTPLLVYGNRFPSDVTNVGFVLVLLTLLPIFVTIVLYVIFRCRISDIVADAK